MLVGCKPGVFGVVLVMSLIEAKLRRRTTSRPHDLDLYMPVGLKAEPCAHRTANAKEDVGEDGCEQ